MLTPNASSATPGVIYWFRTDLRLHDQPALTRAIEQAQQLGGWLLPVYIHDPGLHAQTPWGFQRTSTHRHAWLRMALNDLSARLKSLGSTLMEFKGEPIHTLAELVAVMGNPPIYCEDICAPEEQAQIDALHALGLQVETIWQSTLMAPEDLPFVPEDVPDRFTTFRQALEKSQVRAAEPTPTLTTLPPLPAVKRLLACQGLLSDAGQSMDVDGARPDPRAAFPWDQAGFHGGETAALAHLEQYCRRGLPHTYKITRNGLVGTDFSSKWSPWLATGALSARTAWAAIADFEKTNGANESTYWLGFELLWRDHFRWLHRKYGLKLYTGKGLSQLPPPAHNRDRFEQWCHGQSGHAFIDAGMRELMLTGYLSNRMRQNVASYLVHDLRCDWRGGAAWFEAHLIDYDVYSNLGNWLYISGRGTDPRHNRRFNPDLQASTYDPKGDYIRLWAQA